MRRSCRTNRSIHKFTSICGAAFSNGYSLQSNSYSTGRLGRPRSHPDSEEVRTHAGLNCGYRLANSESWGITVLTRVSPRYINQLLTMPVAPILVTALL